MVLSFSSVASAFHSCPLLGPVYPQPTQLSVDPSFQAAKANLTRKIQQITTTGNSRWTEVYTNISVSFSAGVFSLDEEDLIFDFEWNAPNGSWAPAAQSTVNADTVYAIGSVSKLLTVYTFLSAIGDGCWNEPVSRFVPELEATVTNASQTDPIQYARWDEIAVGDLASQLAGFRRDVAVQQAQDPVPGFPPPKTQACNGELNCTRDQFFETLLQHPPIFASSTTPIYSNTAYAILAFVAENITGEPFYTTFQNSSLTPLALENTSFRRPALNKTIVPSTIAGSPDFPAVGQLNIAAPYGLMFSSLHDMAVIGRSILNSTILPPALTRRWLETHTHTSNPYYSVGAPWEIRRTTVNGRTIDIYGKSGDISGFNSLFLLMPDYNVGTFVAATTSTDDAAELGTQGHDAVTAVSNQIVETLLPALENAARIQALGNFAGSYEDATSNTNMSIAVGSTIPGLNITALSSNGFDDTSLLAQSAAVALPLQPSNLRSGNRVSFRLVPQLESGEVNVEGIASPQCYSWQTIDEVAWNGKSADDFVFTLDQEGRAVSVEPLALQKVLTRIE
ncbi:MAG: hypothetical protein Q9159_000208 [Coniocarpon cinnabarinum]